MSAAALSTGSNARLARPIGCPARQSGSMRPGPTVRVNIFLVMRKMGFVDMAMLQIKNTPYRCVGAKDFSLLWNLPY